MSSSTLKTHNWLAILLISLGIAHLACALSASFIFEGQRYFVLVDDAMISMRYARNLAEAGAIQYNPGDLGTPQGYSNTLWVLLMYLVHALRVPDQYTSLIIMLTGGALHVASVFLIYKITSELTVGQRGPLLAAFLSATFFPLFYWSTRGMELGIQLFLVYLLIYLALRDNDKLRASTILPLVILSILILFARIDSLLILFICFFYIAFNIYFAKSSRLRRIKYCVCYLLIPLAAVQSVFSYNTFFHGDKYPTTYYLKVLGSSLLERVKTGLVVFQQNGALSFIIVVTCIAAFAILSPFKDYLNRRMALLASIFFAQLLYSIYTGGDYAEAHVLAPNRFFAIGFPSAFIILSVLAEKANLRKLLISYKHSPTLAALICKNRGAESFAANTLWVFLALIINVNPLIKMYRDRGLPMLSSDIERAEKGLLIHQKFKPGCRVAAHAAGNIFYFARDSFAIDLLGKSDNAIARSKPVTNFKPGHNKWNYDYSISSLQADIVADRWGEFDEWAQANKWHETSLAWPEQSIFLSQGKEKCKPL